LAVDKYILVIGATGRIGRAYTSHLQKNNAKFVGVSKTGPQYRYNHSQNDFNDPDEEIRDLYQTTNKAIIPFSNNKYFDG
jgi:short-subunit dehydrogenase